MEFNFIAASSTPCTMEREAPLRARDSCNRNLCKIDSTSMVTSLVISWVTSLTCFCDDQLCEEQDGPLVHLQRVPPSLPIWHIWVFFKHFLSALFLSRSFWTCSSRARIYVVSGEWLFEQVKQRAWSLKFGVVKLLQMSLGFVKRVLHKCTKKSCIVMYSSPFSTRQWDQKSCDLWNGRWGLTQDNEIKRVLCDHFSFHWLYPCE